MVIRSASTFAGVSLAALMMVQNAALAQATDAAPAAAPVAEQAAPASPAATNEAAPSAPATAAPAAGGAGDPAAAAEALSPLIEDVQIVGPWSDGDVQGVWRTIMVQSPADETDYHFFVQQLEGSGTNLTLRSSTEIRELNQIEGAVVGYRADEPSETEPNSLSLFFDLLPSDGEIAETYELHFFPDQPYMFGPATN
ncbi:MULTISPECIES: hypothetical protein [Aurantimonas]|uniref:DNA topoisomerase IV subunit B n=1 Tax=Aurantimonas coralicida TaxID=182270 RepID=A0A0P0YZP2_9HYPH|nr:hypothetical protein [Aurantimonas coralicida]MCW7545109.1 hypothetical protein [Aurantimonas litoralis]BAT27060.1 DNA topoisomerase IV subunit B [Aurantimonas coralicida]